jgi:hypothetical protein
MVACLADRELSFGSFTLAVLRRDAEPALKRMAGQLFPKAKGVGDDVVAQKEWAEQHQPDSEENWLRAAGTSEALSFLAEPAEDIYTVEDGEPFRDAL